MRNKILFESKLENLEALIKKVGYHIHRDERDIAYNLIEILLEKLGDMQTLLNTESQD
jgi:hypothetical protein